MSDNHQLLEASVCCETSWNTQHSCMHKQVFFILSLKKPLIRGVTLEMLQFHKLRNPKVNEHQSSEMAPLSSQHLVSWPWEIAKAAEAGPVSVEGQGQCGTRRPRDTRGSQGTRVDYCVWRYDIYATPNGGICLISVMAHWNWFKNEGNRPE